MSDDFNFDDMPDLFDDEGQNKNDLPMPDWLNQGSSFGDDEPEEVEAMPEPEEAPLDLPDWLNQEPTLVERDDESVEMGYQEWIAAEEEAEKEPDISLEVPDWFKDDAPVQESELPSVSDLTGSKEASKDDAFVPDWFMGLEEQNLDDAPDWVKNASTSPSDTGSLLDTSAFEIPEEPARPMFSTPEQTLDSDDLPDWFADGKEEESVPASQRDWFGTAAPEIPDTSEGFSSEPQLNFGLDDIDDELLSDFDFDDDDKEEEEFGFATFVETSDNDDDLPPLGFAELEMESESELPTLPPTFASHNPDLDWLDDIEASIEADKLPTVEEEFAFGDNNELDFGDQNLEVSSFGELDFEAEADAEFDDFGSWEDDAVAELPDFSEPLGVSPERDNVTEFNFDLDAIQKSDLDDLGDIFDDKPKSTPQTQRLITEMQTSSLDISQLIGLDDDINTFSQDASSALIIPESDRALAASDDLFEDVEDSFFESFAAAAPIQLPTAETDDEDDLLGTFNIEEPSAAQIEDQLKIEGQVKPDWISDLRPDMPVKISSGNLEFEFEQTKIADMSDALRSLRDQSAAFAALSKEQDSQEVGSKRGPLAGITGSLRTSDIIAQTTPELQLQTGVSVTQAQARHIAVLASALELSRREQDGLDDSADTKKKSKRRVGARYKIDRLVVSLILLAVLIGPFATDALHLDFVDAPSALKGNDEQAAFVNGIDGLAADDYVLVSFDYGPTVASELNPLAEAVLRDILKRGATPIITSISPLGALNARLVIDELRDDPQLQQQLARETPLQPREDYILLRYIPGEAVGVRSITRSEILSDLLFTIDTDGEETNLNFGTLDASDVAAVIVIGESLDDARRWAEQLQDVPELSKYLLTTAAAEPLAKVYVNADGRQAYIGYLAGYRDTYLYNRSRNPEAVSVAENLDDYNLPETDEAQWYSLIFGVLAAIGLIGLGTLFNLLRLVGGRRS